MDILGRNPEVKNSYSFKSYEDFQKALSTYSIYIYPIERPYGDGYNLGLIEAMSMGMAVITVSNPLSPIIHQQNGLIAKDLSELKKHFHYLLSNPTILSQMGQEAKETVSERFGQNLFLQKWNTIM